MEIAWFVNQPTLGDAITKAAMAENRHGKRYSHQCRIPCHVLQSALKELRAGEEVIRACVSFEDLHLFIKSTLKHILGIGELYCYDAALRIGAKLNLHPQKVYLHAGTRKGAALVTDTKGKHYLGTDCLPVELQQLPPEQVEDILCIYREKIKEIHNE